MNIEWAFNALFGIATAAFWFWANSLSRKIGECEEKISRTMIEYLTREEFRREMEARGRAMERIESKLDQINDKLHQKADK